MGVAMVASEYCFDDCWSPVMGHIESFLISYMHISLHNT